MIKSLLYPLIGSALITITPFLLTFEKGQDIIRGLFGFEAFVLLLLIVFFKDDIKKQECVFFKRIVGVVLLFFTIILLFVVAYIDLQNLLSIKSWESRWFVCLPFVTVVLALAMNFSIKAFSIHRISLIVFIAFFIHVLWQEFYVAQPIAQFPTVDYLDRMASKVVQRKDLHEDFLLKYEVTDSVSISRDFIDSSRSNVIVLVESWGIPLDTAHFAKQLAVFENVLKVGAHNRMYSRTRTAEREDLIHEIITDKETRKRDTIFIPEVLNKKNYETAFLFGSDSMEQWRYKYIRNVGFENVIWGKDSHSRMPLCDSIMANKLDSILSFVSNDSLMQKKNFIAWTTRDTKFPLLGFSNVYSSTADEVDLVYTERLMGTLHLIAELARRHPNVRFIVQGDHNPILSPLAFQEQFYKRWVPYIILN